MNDKKETILLDARLLAMIDKHAFHAELENGHQLVAFFNRKNKVGNFIKSGKKVKVELSPFDMSKGRIINEENNNEG